MSNNNTPENDKLYAKKISKIYIHYSSKSVVVSYHDATKKHFKLHTDPKTNQRYIIATHTNDQKVRLNIIENNKQLTANKQGDYRFCIFLTPLIMAKRIIDYPLNFSYSIFASSANFKASTFEQLAYFNQVVFLKNANFTNATFKDIAYFFDASFQYSSYFTDTLFEEMAYFQRSTFMRVTMFERLRCKKTFNLFETNFNSMVLFINSSFDDKLYLNRSFFGQSLKFKQVSLKREVHAQETQIKDTLAIKDSQCFDDINLGLGNMGVIDLDTCVFHGILSLNNTSLKSLKGINNQHHQEVFLDNATIDGAMHHTKTLFRKKFFLKSVLAKGDVVWDECTFDDDVVWEGAIFDKKVVFKKCLMIQEPFADTATFKDKRQPRYDI